MASARQRPVSIGSRGFQRLLSALLREVEALAQQLVWLQTRVGADGYSSRGEQAHGSDRICPLGQVIRHSKTLSGLIFSLSAVY